MAHYDLIVIGSGAGMNVAARAHESGMKVAVVDKDPLGGTCLNRGCIPSKVWTTAADYIREAQDAEAVGVKLGVEGTDYPLIRKRTWEIVLDGRTSMERGVKATKDLDFLNTTGEFVGDMRLKVAGKVHTAERYVIASGARAQLPPIQGIREVGFLTNDDVFELKALPASIVIVGGGYIACEFGHFMSAMGVEVTILGRNPRLLPREDPEVSAAVLKGMSRHIRIHTNFEVLSAAREGKAKRLVAKDRATGKAYSFAAEEVLLASGRVSNADILRPQATGVEVDAGGWVKTNDHLETTKAGIWAMGDCVNRGQFRHTANHHAGIVWNNMTEGEKVKVDEHAIPSAVFCWPQVGSVGLTAEEALRRGFHAHVGKAMYHDTAKGFAMGDREAFAKVVVDGATGRILGAHIVGPQASVLVQLVVDLMNAEDGTYAPLVRAQVIHPSLAEVVSRAFGALQHAGPGGHEHAHGHSHEHSHEHGEHGEHGEKGEQGGHEHSH